ncbi:MAG TPA: GGDEF domain-containing protein [Terriglobales bacterium]|nr:GGDEF domain-containing protein [Terriglobales bacterium]
MDIRTLLLGDLVLQVCCALGLLLMSRGVPGFRGLRWFAWAYAGATAGIVLMLLQGHLPAPWTMAAGRTLLLLAAVLLTQGIAEFVVPASSALGWGLPLLGVYALVDFLRPHGSPGSVGEVVLFGVAFAAQLLVGILVLASNPHPAERTASRATAGLLAGLATLSLARAAIAPLRRLGPASSSYNALMFGGVVLHMLFSAGMAFGFIWMMTARLRQEWEHQARTDDLTGLPNRRALELAGERELAACRRRGGPLAVLAMDLDHFKQLNDTYGHAAGDRVLAAAARAFAAGLRSSDLVGRLGGEEFAAVLPERDAERALEIAERLRLRLESLRVSFEGQPLRITASLGVAALADPGEGWHELLRRADRALYEAKRAGRNCCRSAEAAPPGPAPCAVASAGARATA